MRTGQEILGILIAAVMGAAFTGLGIWLVLSPRKALRAMMGRSMIADQWRRVATPRSTQGGPWRVTGVMFVLFGLLILGAAISGVLWPAPPPGPDHARPVLHHGPGAFSVVVMLAVAGFGLALIMNPDWFISWVPCSCSA